MNDARKVTLAPQPSYSYVSSPLAASELCWPKGFG